MLHQGELCSIQNIFLPHAWCFQDPLPPWQGGSSYWEWINYQRLKCVICLTKLVHPRIYSTLMALYKLLLNLACQNGQNQIGNKILGAWLTWPIHRVLVRRNPAHEQRVRSLTYAHTQSRAQSLHLETRREFRRGRKQRHWIHAVSAYCISGIIIIITRMDAISVHLYRVSLIVYWTNCLCSAYV